jgi:hypothetical protein
MQLRIAGLKETPNINVKSSTQAVAYGKDPITETDLL